MDKTYNLNFHQTFYANLDYISKILELSDGCLLRTLEEISSVTGIPTGKSSGKVLPHIVYAKYMNLIEYTNKNGNYQLTRTILGEKIFIEDPFLTEKITKLICHYFLTSEVYGAEQWFFMYRNMQGKYGKKINVTVIKDEVGKFFKKSLKLTPFKGCYVNNLSFSNLNLLNITAQTYEFLNFESMNEYYYAILFCLVSELEQLDKNRKEFTGEEIFNNIKWQLAFNWSEKQAMAFFEKTCNDGLTVLNRQMTPMTILFNVSSDMIVERIYSLLI